MSMVFLEKGPPKSATPVLTGNGNSKMPIRFLVVQYKEKIEFLQEDFISIIPIPIIYSLQNLTIVLEPIKSHTSTYWYRDNSDDDVLSLGPVKIR